MRWVNGNVQVGILNVHWCKIFPLASERQLLTLWNFGICKYLFRGFRYRIGQIIIWTRLLDGLDNHSLGQKMVRGNPQIWLSIGRLWLVWKRKMVMGNESQTILYPLKLPIGPMGLGHLPPRGMQTVTDAPSPLYCGEGFDADLVAEVWLWRWSLGRVTGRSSLRGSRSTYGGDFGASMGEVSFFLLAT